MKRFRVEGLGFGSFPKIGDPNTQNKVSLIFGNSHLGFRF